MDLAGAPNPDDFTQSMQSEGDKGLLVKFYLTPKEIPAESAKEGRPVFRDIEYVSISAPGSRNGIARPARDHDKARFPAHYAAFKQREEMPDNGTRLTEWPPMARSIVEQLAFFNVKTVEQLAAIPDSGTPAIMGIARLREMAKNYLAAAKADAPLAAMQAALEERDIRISGQESTIAALTARLDALEATQNPETYQETLPVPPAPTSGLQVAEEPEEPIPTYQSALDTAIEEADPEPEVPKKPRRRRARVKKED